MAVYSIKDIEKMSGIKAHTIRMWERRYGLVIPQRTNTNIRYYSDEDLRDLLNISILNQDGLKISKIAKLNKDEIREKVSDLFQSSAKYKHMIDALRMSMLELDEEFFNRTFLDAWHEHGFEILMEQIIFPFLQSLGMLWQTEAIKPAQEHFISNLLRQKILTLIDTEVSEKIKDKEKIIFFLPEGEIHEFGLLFYSFIAQKEGFEVVYLGASIPLEDLQEIQSVSGAKAFFIAFVAAIEKTSLEGTLAYVRETFPEHTVYITGLQVKELQPTLPNNVFVISSASDFKKKLAEFKQ